MVIYHLEVEAYSTKFGDLQEKNSYESEVHSTLEKALERGKEWLEKRINYLYEHSSYCTKESSLTLQDMIKDEMIYYSFKITEMDPVYADNFEIPKYEYECKGLPPTHIVNHYNLEGELQYTFLEYLSNKYYGSGYVITRYPNDDENVPNKFEIGDFVTIKNDTDIPESQICVVYAVPERNNPKVYFENRYYLSTITEENIFEFYLEYNESQLEKYDGQIDENSPLRLLQRYYRGEIEISEETMRKIENNEILLNIKPTFRDVEELNKL